MRVRLLLLWITHSNTAGGVTTFVRIIPAHPGTQTCSIGPCHGDTSLFSSAVLFPGACRPEAESVRTILERSGNPGTRGAITWCLTTCIFFPRGAPKITNFMVDFSLCSFLPVTPASPTLPRVPVRGRTAAGTFRASKSCPEPCDGTRVAGCVRPSAAVISFQVEQKHARAMCARGRRLQIQCRRPVGV